jgi:hypothetical protein
MPPAYNDWSPFMKALMAVQEPEPMSEQTPIGGSSTMIPPTRLPATRLPSPMVSPPSHRIEDDRTAGTRGTTPQSPTTTPTPVPTTGRSPIQGSIDAGQTTQLADRIPRPPNALEQRIAENKRTLAEPEPMPTTLGDQLLPGGGFWKGLGRTAINLAGGGVGQTLRDRVLAQKLKERERLQTEQGADVRALSGQQEAETRLQEQEELRARLNEETLRSRERNVDAQQTGATGRTGMQVAGREQIAQSGLNEKVREFNSTDEYRRWKEQLDADTRMRIARMRVSATQNKAPAAMMQTAEFASGGLNRLTSADAAMARLEQSGIMGQSWAQNKVEDWIFGKGAVDPNLTPQQRQDIGQLRAALGYTSSAAMRAHTGRTSREIYDDFKTRLGANQDWSALRGAMNETHDMLYQYATSASDASIAAIRSGTNVPPANAPANTPSPTGGQQQAQPPPRPPKPGMKWQRNTRTNELREVPDTNAKR